MGVGFFVVDFGVGRLISKSALRKVVATLKSVIASLILKMLAYSILVFGKK